MQSSKYSWGNSLKRLNGGDPDVEMLPVLVWIAYEVEFDDVILTVDIVRDKNEHRVQHFAILCRRAVTSQSSWEVKFKPTCNLLKLNWTQPTKPDLKLFWQINTSAAQQQPSITVGHLPWSHKQP